MRAPFPVGRIGKARVISLEITACIQGVAGDEVEFRNMSRKPGDPFVIQHQQLLCRFFQLRDHRFNRGVTSRTFAVHVEIEVIAAEFEAGSAYGELKGETSRFWKVELTYVF